MRREIGIWLSEYNIRILSARIDELHGGKDANPSNQADGKCAFLWSHHHDVKISQSKTASCPDRLILIEKNRPFMVADGATIMRINSKHIKPI